MPHPRISIQLILSIDINPQNVNIIHRSIGGSFHYVGAKLSHHLSCKDKEKETTCIEEDMLSLSLRISCRFFVPKMFLRVVWASSLQKKRRFLGSSFLFNSDKNSHCLVE